MRKKRLFYVSHPYGGKPENEKAVQAVIEELKEKHIPISTDFPTMYYSNVEFVSPIQLLGPLYDAMPYLEGLNLCLSLLKRCDTSCAVIGRTRAAAWPNTAMPWLSISLLLVRRI